jgi:hypothetical protein
MDAPMSLVRDVGLPFDASPSALVLLISAQGVNANLTELFAKAYNLRL